MADIGARQVYQWVKTGTPAIVKVAEDMLAAKKVGGVTAAQMEKNKDKGFAEFVTKWQIPTVEGRVGGTREGLLKNARELFGEGTVEYKSAVTFLEAQRVLAEAVTKKGKVFAPAFIRGTGKPRVKKETAATPATPAAKPK